MKQNNINDESRIEVLRCRMEEAINQKNKSVKEFERKISEVDIQTEKFRRELKWFEDYLSKLKQKREMEEIKCFKEIVSIHKEILQATKKISGME